MQRFLRHAPPRLLAALLLAALLLIGTGGLCCGEHHEAEHAAETTETFCECICLCHTFNVSIVTLSDGQAGPMIKRTLLTHEFALAADFVNGIDHPPKA